MAIHLKMNPYKGVNAHYSSFLQRDSNAVNAFRHDHITDLKSYLNRELPHGYYAVSEPAFLVYQHHLAKPDITEFSKGIRDTEGMIVTPSFQMKVEPMAAAPKASPQSDRPIVRFEVLTPAHKTTHLEQYAGMRDTTLERGVYLVELDYMHESPSPFLEIMPETMQKPEVAYPFAIVLTDPFSGAVRFYGFHVDEEIPVLVIPLAENDENVSVDFGEVYNHTFGSDRRAQMMIDYSRRPLNVEAYGDYDRAQINTCMVRIQGTRKTHATGTLSPVTVEEVEDENPESESEE